MPELISKSNIYMPHLGEDDSKLHNKEIVEDSIKGETRKERAKRYNLMEAERRKEEKEVMEYQKKIEQEEEEEERKEAEEKEKEINERIERVKAKKAAGTFKMRKP